jgi:DNA-binding NarL/FixJ family response regulator
MDKRILLVDGYRLTRYCLYQSIGETGGYKVTVVDDVDVARGCIRNNTFDLILIDVSDPLKNGLETYCDVHALLPDTPVLIVNGESDDSQMQHYLRLGCKAYLTSEAEVHELVTAMNRAVSGSPDPSSRLPEKVESPQTADRDSPDYEKLSSRELQIFLKLLRGKSTTRIASELAITASSVSVFKSKLLQKLRLNSHADLIAYALKFHLVRFPETLPVAH